MGGGEIFLWTMLLGVPIGLGLRLGYRMLRNSIEIRQIARSIEQRSCATARREPSRLAPAAVALIQFLILVWLLDSNGDPLALLARQGLCLVGAIFCLIWAFAAHGFPQHSRTAKYSALCMAALLMQVSVWSVVHDSLLWTFAVFPVSLLVVSLLSHLFRDRAWNRGRMRLLAIAIHRITMILGPPSVGRKIYTFMAMRTGAGLPGYLMLRYFVRPFVCQRPFLYLRSFADDYAQEFFGAVLAPSVGSRGVIVSVIHARQTGEQLHRDARSAWHAEVVVLPDAAWRDWVKQELPLSIGVVIDISIDSESVTWELQQVLQCVPLDRVLVASRRPIPEAVAAAGITTLTYSLETAEQRQEARTILLTWADVAVHSSLREELAGQPPISAPTSLLPLAMFAILLWAGISVVITFVNAEVLAPLGSHFTADYVGDVLMAINWYLPQQVAHVVSALALLAAAPLFPLEGLSSQRVSGLWLRVPCVLVALTSLVAPWVDGSSAAIIIGAIEDLALMFGAGYVVFSCLCAYMQTSVQVDLDTTILALLGPSVLAGILSPLPRLVIQLRMPVAAWIGAALLAAMEGIAAYKLVRLVRGATRLRAGAVKA